VTIPLEHAGQRGDETGVLVGDDQPRLARHVLLAAGLLGDPDQALLDSSSGS
jgi:hypothetical protein